MQGTDAHAMARREMAREKARIYGKETKQVSFLEQQAEKWAREREPEEWKKNEIEAKEERGVIPEEGIALREVSTPFVSEEGKAPDTAGWAQYDPWKKEGEEAKEAEQKTVSTATIWRFAKRLMAQEWARAKGIKRSDPRLYSMEREAGEWKGRKEEEKRRIEERNRRIQKQRELVEESLQVFGEKLLEGRGNLTAERAAAIFEDTLESVGEVIDVNWAGDGCNVWIEPWEQKRLRRQRRDPLPVLYHLKIDDNLRILSYKAVEDRTARVEKQGDRLAKLLQASAAELPETDDEDAIRKVVEDKLEEVGRIVEMRREKDEWSVEIEPWEEMRVRNVVRRGRPPIVTYQVKAKMAEGSWSCEVGDW